MISSVYILYSVNLHLQYLNSEVLLHRSFYDDLPELQIVLNNFDTAYKSQLSSQKTPVFNYNGINYIYLTGQNDIFLLLVTRKNIDVMALILFLCNFRELMTFYLCNKPSTPSILDKDVILDNIYFVYEVLDECMDSGIIQMTDYNILKEYIKMIPSVPRIDNDKLYDSDSSESDHEIDDKLKNHKPNSKDVKKIRSTHNRAVKADEVIIDENHVNSSILRASSLAINWRPKGIFYAKNEIYVDLIENCDFLYDLQNNVILNNEVFGNCIVRCYLSGMPSCTIGFNETRISKIDNEKTDDSKRSGNQLSADLDEEETEIANHKRQIPFQTIQFHQCVELDSIYNDNLMKFIPPDDKFVLMSYHVEQQKQRRKLPLFMIKPTFRINKVTKKLQILCILSSSFKKRLHGKNLVIKIPINPVLFHVLVETDLKYKTESGKVDFKIDSSELIWTLDDLPGNSSSVKMMTEVSLQDDIDNLTTDQIQSTLQNQVSEPDESDNEDDIEEARKELDKYYGVNGSKSSAFEEIQRKLKKIKSFNHIKFSYNIPMLSYTGLKLNYLKVEETDMKYTCFPWVRYETQSGNNNQKTNLTLVNSSSNCTYRFKLGICNFQILS